jgi:RNA polymerase sigma-70 factor (ECF subfamily)
MDKKMYSEIQKTLSFNKMLTDDDKQEITLRVWENLEKYNEDKSSFSNWVSVIAKRYSIDKYRKQKNDTLSNSVETPDYVFFIESNELSPENSMIASEEKEKLYKAINMLSDKYKNVIIKFLEGDYKTPDSTEKSHLLRAKKKLREIIEKM